MPPASRPARRHLATSPFAAPTPPTTVHYEVGDLVDSDRYGLGRVASVERDDDDVPNAVVVQHRGGDARRFTLPSSTLRRLGGDSEE